MEASTKPWTEIKVAVETTDTAPIYPLLVNQWIDEAAKHGIAATRVGSWPSWRIVDHASYNGEYVALLQIGEELAVLSLSNINAVQCNARQRTLQARELVESDNLRRVFGYAGAS